jgi:hypothetical protein
MSQRLRNVFRFVIFPIGCCIVLAAALVVTCIPRSLVTGVSYSTTALLESRQPATLNYQSFDPYVLAIFKEQRVTGSKYVIVIHRGTAASAWSYGHYVDFPVNPAASDDDEIKASQVTWAPEGVTLTATSGHTLFIPKKMFIGGR